MSICLICFSSVMRVCGFSKVLFYGKLYCLLCFLPYVVYVRCLFLQSIIPFWALTGPVVYVLMPGCLWFKQNNVFCKFTECWLNVNEIWNLYMTDGKICYMQSFLVLDFSKHLIIWFGFWINHVFSCFHCFLCRIWPFQVKPLFPKDSFM